MTMFRKTMTAADTIYRIDPSSPMYDRLRTGSANQLANRQPQPGNVASLRLSIQKINAIRYCPIIVDKNLNVIDGQNRYEAAIAEGLPYHVVFIDEDVDAEQLMLTLNTGPIYPWKLINHVHFHAGRDRLYQQFIDCLETYPEVNISVMFSVFMGSSFRFRGEEMHQFKKGQLQELMDRRGMNMQKVYHTLSQMYRVKGNPTNPILTTRVFRLQSLQLAILRVLQSIPMQYDEFINRLHTTPHNLNKLRTVDDFEQEMYDILYRR